MTTFKRDTAVYKKIEISTGFKFRICKLVYVISSSRGISYVPEAQKCEVVQNFLAKSLV